MHPHIIFGRVMIRHVVVTFGRLNFSRLKHQKVHVGMLFIQPVKKATGITLKKNHILESEGSDPMGPYQYKDTPMKDHWNIDGSYFKHEGELFFLWSEWHGDDQVNLISKMTNPWTIEGERTVITKPEFDWEISGLRVNEGPEIIKHDGRTFIVHSASFCNTEDYKLAVVELTGENPLKAESWTKYDEPFFSKGNGVFGPGHHGFFYFA